MDWSRVLPLLERAFELEPPERAAFVDDSCGADPALRRFVLELIDEELNDVDFLSPGLLAGSAADTWTPEPGAIVARYRLAERIGAGGMGEVWLAERAADDFDQRVAIKLIRLGMHTDEVLQRFKNERQVLAALSHPNIPRLLDGGATPDGRPFLVMDYVAGAPIDAFVRRQELDVRDTIELMVAVCDAVQHAHDCGVIHRDIKTSNVLIDELGTPKLLDFGIAKILEAEAPWGAEQITVTGQYLFTPRWASPEQVRGGSVTPATDVHALGLLIWELIVGEPAVEASAVSMADMFEAICDRPVRAPSACVADRRRRASIRGDLETIVGMALRKEPERRYPSASELATDLRPYLAGRPALASADSIRYQLGRFTRRHRGLVTGTAAVMFILLAGVVMTSLALRSARVARTESRLETYTASLHAAESALRDGHASLALERLTEAPEELRGWEWRHLSSRLRRGRLVQPGAASNRIFPKPRVRRTSDGAIVASSDGGIVQYDGRGHELARWEHGYQVFDLHPESGALACDDSSGGLHVVAEPAAGLEWVDAAHATGSEVSDIAWCPNGRWIAASRSDGSVAVWDAGARSVRCRFSEHEPAVRGGRLRWHPDGRRLASAGWDETVQLYDVEAKKHLGGWRAHKMSVEDLDFDATGTLLVTASIDRTIVVWEVDARRPVGLLRPLAGEIFCVRFVGSGGRLVVADDAGTVRLVDWRTEEVLSQFLGHGTGVRDLDLDVASGSLVTIDSTSSVRAFRLDSRDVLWTQVCEYLGPVDVSPAGDRLAVGSPDDFLRVMTTSTLALQHELHVPGVDRLDWGPIGNRLALSSANGRIVILDTRTFEPEREFACPGFTVLFVALDPGETHVGATLSSDETGERVTRVWRIRDGLEVASLPREGSPTQRSHFVLARGGRVAVPGSDAPWTTTDVQAPNPDEGEGRALAHVAVFGDEALIVLVRGREVRVIDPEAQREIARWECPDTVRSVALRPQRDRIALASGDRVEIWDPRNARRLVSLHGHASWVRSVSWSANGRTLVSGGAGGRVCVWSDFE